MRAAFRTLALIALTACATSGSTAHGTSNALPDFSLPDTDGRTVQLSELVGKGLLYIDFWATWCGPCAAEMPQLQRLFDTYKGQGFTVLAISMDDPTTMGLVASYVHRNGLTFPVAIDNDSRATSLYNSTRTAPYGLLIDRSGRIVEEKPGYTPGDEVALETQIKAHL